MTTIHNGVSQFESQRAPQTPRLDLTAADREVISDLGARALAVAEERVQNIIEEREAALLSLIDAAEGRAADAVATADTLVAEAERRTIEAEASRNAAVIERDAGVASEPLSLSMIGGLGGPGMLEARGPFSPSPMVVSGQSCRRPLPSVVLPEMWGQPLCPAVSAAPLRH